MPYFPLPPHFQSFFQGGFECAYPIDEHHVRMDLLADTKHDLYCRSDYELMRSLGIETVREGLSWSQIDKGHAVYDFSRFEKMMKIGKVTHTEQIWDLNHFDYPEYIDFFSDEFPQAFASYAQQAIKTLRTYSEKTLYIVPQNEISFFSFIGGDHGVWAPHQKNRGVEMKKQLVKATLLAMKAIWDVDTDVRFIHVDPIFYRTPKDLSSPEQRAVADAFIEAKFQAWDMISGAVFPELGGDPEYLDILGANYYYYNQEWIVDAHNPADIRYETIPLNSQKRISIRAFLQEIHDRYRRPIVITETGGWGDLRKKWWGRILPECLVALDKGSPLYGICSYPIIDRPDWTDGHLTNSGFYDFIANDPVRQRYPHQETISVVQPYIVKMNSLFKKDAE